MPGLSGFSAQALPILDRLSVEDRLQREAGLSSEQRTRNVDRDIGAFLYLLTTAIECRRILEIWSSNGVSTLWFAAGLVESSGYVLGTEILPARAEEANRNLLEAGFGEIGRVLAANARHILHDRRHEIEPFELVFIDEEKDDYREHFDAAWPVVRPGGVVLADNVTSHDLSDYQSMIADRSDAETVTLTIGRGVDMTRKMTAG
jgi:predicted O-methyltransferase YrrM